MTNNILVTGATGHLGGHVIEHLLKKIPTQQITVLTRNKEKQAAFTAQGFRAINGSYDNRAALEKAMEGVATVLLISAGDQGDRMQEHKNVIDTARKKGVKHLAYTGRCLNNRNTLVNKLMLEHFATEDYLKASGLKYTIVRNVLYLEAIPQFIGGNDALNKGIFLPASEGKVAFALRSEMGEAIAHVLLTDQPESKIYNFTGNTAYSFYDVARALSELSGREVKYTPVESTVFAASMKQRQVPEAMIQKIADFIADIKNNQEAGVYPDLENTLGRKPTPLKDGLQQVFKL